jgi:hypothetical protein
MARTEEEQTTEAAQKTAAAEAQQAFQTGQSGVGQYEQNEATLNKGGDVAANPWLSAEYLSNQNRLQSGALNSATNAGTNMIQQNNRRTGGLNSGATIGAVKDITGEKMRLGNQLSAERSANDFNKNVSYQQGQAQAPLAVTQAESPYFGTGQGGVNSLNNNLTQYGMLAQQQFNSLVNKGIGAGADFAGGA